MAVKITLSCLSRRPADIVCVGAVSTAVRSKIIVCVGAVSTAVRSKIANLTIAVILMLLEPPPQLVGEKRLTFRDLDWRAFKQIQSWLADRTRARFTYDSGVLEITKGLE